MTDPSPTTTLDLRTPQEWCDLLDARVVDPDGWRDGTRDWQEQIGRDEFDQRLNRCTVDGRGYPTFLTIPGSSAAPEPTSATPTAPAVRAVSPVGSVSSSESALMHPLSAKEKDLRDWLRTQPGGAEKWLLIKAGFRRSYEHGLADANIMHQAYRPEVVAEVAVHLGSHQDWDEIVAWCGGRIETSQDPSGEYSSTLVLPNGESGGEWAWLVLDHTGEFHIRAEVEAPSARSLDQIRDQALHACPGHDLNQPLTQTKDKEKEKEKGEGDRG